MRGVFCQVCIYPGILIPENDKTISGSYIFRIVSARKQRYASKIEFPQSNFPREMITFSMSKFPHEMQIFPQEKAIFPREMYTFPHVKIPPWNVYFLHVKFPRQNNHFPPCQNSQIFTIQLNLQSTKFTMRQYSEDQ